MIKNLQKEFFKIFLLFIIWRLGLFLIAYVSPSIISEFGAKFPYFNERLVSSGLPHFIWSFGNFDGVHYLGIAEDGYSYQFTQAFFPVYPVLIKIFSFFTLGNLMVSALLISNVAFLLGLLIFFKLVRDEYNQKIAFWSTVFLLAFPTSFFFGAVYTEGLFFLQITTFFYLLNRKKIWIASIIGSIASATRLIGLFLTVPILLKKKKSDFVPTAVITSGLVFYMSYLKFKFNNPFYFLSAQSVFGQERTSSGIILLPQVFYRYIKIIFTAESGVTIAFFEAASVIFAVSLLILAFKKVKTEWIVFSLLSIVLPTLTGTFASMPRYVLIAFPIYIVLAMVKNQFLKISMLCISLSLLILATLFFTQGYWVA